MKNLVNRNLDEFLLETNNIKKKETKGEKKFKNVLSHWKEGKQHIGKTNKIVPRTKQGMRQALAIAFSEKEETKNL